MIRFMTVRCVVHLPESVLSEPNVLALKVPVNLSVRAQCFFPGPQSAHQAGGMKKLSAPPIHDSSDGWPDADWGMVSVLESGNVVRLVAVNALGIEFDQLDIEQTQELDKKLNSWANSLHSWISVLMRGPTAYMLTLGGVSWPWEFQEELLGDAYAEGRLYEPQGLTDWQWRHALEHVAAGDTPPMNRILLASAMTHVSNENYRTCILDSATAAELTLSEAISKSICEHGGDGKLSELLLKGKTLGGLVGLAKGLSVPVPDDISKSLIEIRNRVMHAGYLATEGQARSAMRIAQEVIAELNPFPFHCDEQAREVVSLGDWEEFTRGD